MDSIGDLHAHLEYFTLPNVQRLGEAESRALDRQTIKGRKKVVRDDLKHLLEQLEVDSMHGALDHDKSELHSFLREALLTIEWTPHRIATFAYKNMHRDMQFLSIMCPGKLAQVNRLRNYL